MSGGIFLIQSGGELVEMKEQPYDSEDVLQELLAKYPNLLAGDQMDAAAPRRWLLICREMGVPDEEEGGDRWSLDHLFLDQDAIPTLVEVKRSCDTRIRREVVGQMLDYAANAVLHWPVETIRARFEKECERRGADATEELAAFLGAGGKPEEFWQRVKTNLQAGRVRLVFVADEVPPELRRIVEFLNGQMDPAEVLALEVKQFVGQGLKTLVPRVIGQTAEAEKKRAGTAAAARQWDEAGFFGSLAEKQDATAVARGIYDWGRRAALHVQWSQGQNGAFYLGVPGNGKPVRVVAVRTGFKNPYAEVQFGPLKDSPAFSAVEKREELQRRLNAIPGVRIKDDELTKYPGIHLALLNNGQELQRFLDALEWVVGQLKAG